MDDKQKSKKYFNRHSSTFVNRNGYWNYDYRLTSRILKKRNVKKLVDIGCGNGAFLELFHKLSPGTKLAGLDLSYEMVLYKMADRRPRGLFQGGNGADAACCRISEYPLRDDHSFQKSCVLYTTSDRQEGYLMLSGEGAGGSIGFLDGMKIPTLP